MSIDQPAFLEGVIKSAHEQQASPGDVFALLKYATSLGIPQIAQQPASPPPVTPLVDTVKPSSMFPVPTPSPQAPPQPPGGSYGYNINQTGLGGSNNSVTSAPSGSVNSVLNKPTTPSATPALGGSI